MFCSIPALQKALADVSCQVPDGPMDNPEKDEASRLRDYLTTIPIFDKIIAPVLRTDALLKSYYKEYSDTPAARAFSVGVVNLRLVLASVGIRPAEIVLLTPPELNYTLLPRDLPSMAIPAQAATPQCMCAATNP